MYWTKVSQLLIFNNMGVITIYLLCIMVWSQYFFFLVLV